MARDEIAEMTGLRLAIHAWIREDAPLAAKMNLMPRHVDALMDRIAAEIASLRSQDREDGARAPRVEFYQQDFMPGFAAFLPGATTPAPDARAFCVLNVGSMMAALQAGDFKREELPYFIAESMMHEVIHVLEQWAGVAFNEDRVEALLERYRAAFHDEETALPLRPAQEADDAGRA